MRQIFFFSLMLGMAAYAQADAKLDYLSKQLATAKDPRLRTQAAVILGASKTPAAVTPLCRALKDSEAVVRSAVARAIAELRQPSGLSCLKSHKEFNPEVRTVVANALAALAAAASVKSLYVALEPIRDETGNLSSEDLKLAESLLREKLGRMGARFAPAGESKSAAQSVVRGKGVKGYLLRPKVNVVGAGLKFDLLVMTYPEQSLKGTYNVKASGAKPPALLKAMVPRVVDDAAHDLEWNQ
jgi:hypothetical protein